MKYFYSSLPARTCVATVLSGFLFFISGTAFGQAPANDLCADAIPIVLDNGWLAATNVGTVAANNGPNLNCGGGQLVKDVWFSFTFTGGTITISTQLGTLNDTRIGVRETCTSPVIACNDDASGIGLASRLVLGCAQLTVGQSYVIQAGGYQQLAGTFNIQIQSSDITGCDNPLASNYDPCATIGDASCTFDALAVSFSATSILDCSQLGVTYTSSSVGNIESLSWLFPGGNPATSSATQVVVTYEEAGIYNATLTATELGGNQLAVSQNIDVQPQIELVIDIAADNYPAETTWKVFDQLGLEVASGIADSTSVCLDAGQCHQFVIYDSYGDGICCAFGEGSYTLSINGVGLATGGLFGFEEAVSVNCPPGSDCNNAIAVGLGTHTAPLNENWFTFTPDTSGQFIISTCDLSTCPTTIWIYDYCNMANFDDSNAATYTFNDGFCGDQAQITNVMASGTEYFIRVRWDEDPTAPCQKDVFIDFLGPIPGCSNPNACNYEPLAQIPGPCYFNDDPECSDLGPDLSIRNDVYYNSMYLTTINATDACLVSEGCVQGFGQRQVVRFTTYIDNIGNQDYFIGVPNANNPQFEYDPCHNHYHYEGYAEYLLFNGDGFEMPQIGFKNGFCVLDLTCPNGGQAKFGCGNMGITAGCADYYSSGLQCQWVDITDVPAGTYTMVARTNWDQSPDNAGRYELRYDNNWAAVCISFERDASNNIINFTKSLDCLIPIDCIGQPFGSSIPDCAGQCGGNSHTGNLNANPELQTSDVDLYLSGIAAGSIDLSACTDVNNDGSITVFDAALVSDCVIQGTDQVDENGVHNHCIFGNDLVNPDHLVTLSLGNLNLEEGFFDVHVLNPDCKMVGFEFVLSGATITSVENLAGDVFDYDTSISTDDGRVVGLSQVPQFLIKQYSPFPFLRVFFSALTQEEICISEIADVVNDNYHGVITAAGPCISSAPSGGTIAGSASWPIQCGSRPMTISLRDGSDNVTSYTTEIGGDGIFSLEIPASGTFDIVFKVDGALAQIYTDVVIGSSETTMELGALVMGEITNDNLINISDLTLMVAHFGTSSTDTNYLEMADLNCDSFIDISDLTLMITSFGLSGASFMP